ncbi:MAG: HDOD domain-containing protein [Pseudomonadota bacterium]
MSKKIGRFEILRELGRGAQSIVYLALDPHLQREVAIKTLHFARSDTQRNQQLLAEARMVSQLSHRNIVPIFEAGEEGGDPYLVFEYVPGQNLGEYLKSKGAVSPTTAFKLMVPVLQAIAHAHAAGIIHRDLKPHNILLDELGVPRVMDFGIAAQVEQKAKSTEASASGIFVGTPAYMAPEYIGGQESSERTDVFSAGLVLYELLTAEPAIRGDDPFHLMNQIANEDIVLPKNPDLKLDDEVASILLTALARDPQRRYASADAMRQAIESYLDLAAVSSLPQLEGQDSQRSTIDFLLRRMRHTNDFPALSDSVNAINKLTSSDRDNISKLSDAILKDFALTNKILRLVNSAAFNFNTRSQSGKISTISRALHVLGFDAVRSITITTLLFEHLQNQGNATYLREEFLRANLAGMLAKNIAIQVAVRDVEQIFICAMFHNLGRLLSQYYFPEENEKIRRLVQQKPGSEEASALQVLGASFEDLGIGVAESWGFPKLIVNSMRKLESGIVHKPGSLEDRLRHLSAFSNELCGMIIDDVSPENRHKELPRILTRFAESISIGDKELRTTIEKTLEEVVQFSDLIHVNLQKTAFGKQIKAWGSGKADLIFSRKSAVSDADQAQLSARAETELVKTQASDSPLVSDAASRLAETILMSGIQDISNTLVEDFKLNDVLRIILETMYRAKGFRHVLLCIRDARNNLMTGRFGFGPNIQDLAKHFVFSLAPNLDVFHAALSKGVDILISDTQEEKIAERIPAWFRKVSAAQTFIVFPLCMKGIPVAMIYAEREYAGEIVVSEKELSLLRTLRNQAVLAIKQAT